MFKLFSTPKRKELEETHMRKSQFMRLGLLAVMVILTATTSVSAQSGLAATILGVVADETGAVLPGVEVSVSNTETGNTRNVVSNDVGLYRVPNLTPGSYEVRAELAGFRAFVGTGINAAVGQEITVDVTLQVGAVTEEITVTGAGQLVNTTSGTMQALVDEVKVRELPLNGRDYLALATLQPGIIENRGQRQTRISPQTGTGLNLSISGGRPNSNVFRMDGIVINDHANSSPGSIGGANLGVDAIREFSALTNTYSAEYGRASGGVINTVLRSGTNDVHGSAFFFHRNKSLDARNYFNPKGVPQFRRHQYGGTFGGPLARDRTFLFGAYEKLTEFREKETSATVPTAAAKAGTLTGGNVTVNDAMLPLIALYPDPTAGTTDGNVGTLHGAPGSGVDADFMTLRGDHQFTDNLFYHGSYLIEDAQLQTVDSFQLNERYDTSRRQFISSEFTYLISPTVISATRFGYNRSNMVTGDSKALKPELSLANSPTNLAFVPNRPAGFVVINSDGVDDFPGGDGSEDIDAYLFESTQFYQDISVSQGKHDMKFGMNIEIIRDRGSATNRENGELSYATLSDFLQDKNVSRFRGQGADSDTTRHFRQKLYGGYAQDRIAVSNNFSMDLGLRWEMVTSPTEAAGEASKMINFKDTTLTTGGNFFTTPKINLSPRIGFAWDVFGDGKTALRGGFGVFHEMHLVNLLTIPALRMPPHFIRFDLRTADCTFPNGAFPLGAYTASQACLTAEQTAAGSALAGLSADPIQANPPAAYRMQYNLNIQQELAQDTVLQIGYVGGQARHLIAIDPDHNLATGMAESGRLFFKHAGCASLANCIDSAIANSGGDGNAAQTRRNPFWNRMGLREFNGSATYHALQMSLNRRFTEGLRAQMSYTFSKSIDLASATFTENQFQNGQGPPYAPIPKLNRGPSDFNVAQSLQLNGTYDLPFDFDGGAGTFLNGWQIGGIGSFMTGEAMYARHAGDWAKTLTGRNSSGSGVQRPDLVGGASQKPSGGKVLQFNPAAFELPGASLVPGTPCGTGAGEESSTSRCSAGGKPGVAGVLGNLGRNTMETTGYQTVDLVLTKNNYVPAISEDFNVQIRVEAFNALNRTTFDVPKTSQMSVFAGDGTLNSTAGKSNRTFTNSREIQLGLKLIF